MVNSLHLYKLTNEYLDLINNGELTEEELKSKLATNQTAFNDKAENTAKLVLELNAEAEMIDREIARLSARKTARLNRASWLKDYLFTEMMNSGKDKVEGQVLNLLLKKNPPSVNILNQDEVPQEYRKTIPESWTINKSLILSDFSKSGAIPKGCDIITDKKHLEIK